MKFGKKILLAAILMTMVGFELSAIDNMNTRPDEPMGYENYWSCISRKLGRGICNTAFGAIEIPLQMAKTSAVICSQGFLAELLRACTGFTLAYIYLYL